MVHFQWFSPRALNAGQAINRCMLATLILIAATVLYRLLELGTVLVLE